MSASTDDITKSPKRRPTETGTFIGVRLQAEPLARLDEWRRAQSDLPGRPEAIRRLIDLGIEVSKVKGRGRD